MGPVNRMVPPSSVGWSEASGTLQLYAMQRRFVYELTRYYDRDKLHIQSVEEIKPTEIFGTH